MLSGAVLWTSLILTHFICICYCFNVPYKTHNEICHCDGIKRWPFKKWLGHEGSATGMDQQLTMGVGRVGSYAVSLALLILLFCTCLSPFCPSVMGCFSIKVLTIYWPLHSIVINQINLWAFKLLNLMFRFSNRKWTTASNVIIKPIAFFLSILVPFFSPLPSSSLLPFFLFFLPPFLFIIDKLKLYLFMVYDMVLWNKHTLWNG